MPKHDQGYKSLFSHPEMVRDLLLGFVHEDWVKHLDFNSLEKASSETHQPSDMVEVINNLVTWLNDPQHASLKRAIVTWIKRVLSPTRLNGLDLPQELNLLEELRDMLAGRVKKWE